MPTFGSTILLTKFYYVISRFRSKKGEGIYSPEIEKKLAPIGSDVAIVLASAFSFNNRSSSSSFSNAFMFLTLRRTISLSRFFRKACCFLKRFIFARFSVKKTFIRATLLRVVWSSLLILERFFLIFKKSDDEILTALYLIPRRI